MDWQLDFLEPLTIEVDFQRGGKSLYSATTWAGYGSSFLIFSFLVFRL